MKEYTEILAIANRNKNIPPFIYIHCDFTDQIRSREITRFYKNSTKSFAEDFLLALWEENFTASWIYLLYKEATKLSQALCTSATLLSTLSFPPLKQLSDESSVAGTDGGITQATCGFANRERKRRRTSLAACRTGVWFLLGFLLLFKSWLEYM